MLRVHGEAVGGLGVAHELEVRLVEGLRVQGWALPESQANFVWFDLGERTMQRAEEARAAGAIVRPFAGEGLRVSVGEPEATDLFLRVSATWL